MQLFSTVVSYIRQPSQISEFAKEVASSTHDSIWEKVHQAACRMGHHEARGYVRVRAISLVAAEADRFLEDRSFRKPLNRAHLIDLATEVSVRNILSELMVKQLAQPTENIDAYRRAA